MSSQFGRFIFLGFIFLDDFTDKEHWCLTFPQQAGMLMFCRYTFRLPSEQQPQQQQTANSGPSPSRSVSSSAATATQNGANRSSQPVAAGLKPGALPANLDEFKVSQLSNGSLSQCVIKYIIIHVLLF